MTKVLLINSDLAANRGDRAIAEGNIELIKRQFPDAEITGLSEHPFRDRKWYGIDFINMNFQSLGILDFFRLAHAARRSDIILWGGGEILKDYTNKAALWYWAAKISFLSLINPDIYGAFQGIGPTRSQRSKRTIARVVGHCKLFMVRDQESADKLVEWGVDPAKIRAAADPAILPKAEAIDDALAQKLQASYDIDDAFLDDFICVGPRDWFHYKPGGIIPFKYKKPLYKLIGRSVITREDPRHARYVAQLGSLIARLSHDHPQRHILFIPMHMSETDSWLCNKLRQFAADQTNIRVLDHDNVSPQELRNIMARARATIGFRLHSTIIATSAGVPSINLYYVDKGRVYFDQIGQHTHALPIERVLEDDFVPTITAMLQRLLKNEAKTRKSITKTIDGLRTTISDTFTDVFSVSDEITTTQTEVSSSRSKKQKLIKIIPAIFYVLLIAFFILYIHSINFSKLHGAEFNWWYILLSIVFGLIFRYLGTYIWIIILRGLGAKDVKYSATLIYVYAKSWLGRYIPGTAPWILGKIYFASQHGISKNKLAVSSLLEGALQIVAQLVLSFALLVFDARLNKVSTDFKVLMTVVLIGCIICLIPPVFNFFVALAYRVLRHKTLEREHYANTQTILRGAGMYMVAAIINGFALYYIAKGVYGPLDYSQILFVMGVGTLAGAASMLAIFAPSGIGVREGIQLTLLSIIMPASFALIITVFTRIVSIITDLLFFGLASGADRITKK